MYFVMLGMGHNLWLEEFDGVDEITQWVKVPADKIHHLSSIPGVLH